MARDRTARATQRPLRWGDLGRMDPLAGGEPPGSSPPSRLTYYVSGRPEETPDPRVSIEEMPGGRDRAFWRVDVDLGEDITPNLPGLAATPLHVRDLPTVEPDEAGVPSYRPRDLAASYLPAVEKPGRVVLKRADGREYRPLFVFPPDERVILTDTSWPWLLIGKVTNSDGKAGSGALVGGRVLLTARHVAPWQSIGAGNWWMKFVPHGWDGAEPFGSSFVSDIRYPTDSDIAHDYLIGRLYEPLGDRLGWFGTTTYDDDWEDESVWAAVGYPGDIAGGQRPVVQLGASINEDYGNGDGVALTTQADLNHGESGGPFWAWFDQDPRIVGVVSGETDIQTDYVIATVDDYENALGGGEHLVRLVRWGQENWPV